MVWKRDSEAIGTPIQVPIDGQTLSGDLNSPEDAQGLVLFAHGSRSEERRVGKECRL